MFMYQKGFLNIIIAIIVGAAIVLGGVYVYVIVRRSGQLVATPTEQPESQQSSSQAPFVMLPPPAPFQISKEDYGLLNFGDVVYATGGTIDSGKYAGYHLIFGGINKNKSYLFATKDFKTFIVDTTGSGEASSTNPSDYFYAPLNRNRAVGDNPLDATDIVVGADSFVLSPPDVIDEGNLVLMKDSAEANWYYQSQLASSTPLASNVPGIWFFNPSTMNGILVENAQGIVFRYILFSKEGANRLVTSPSNSTQTIPFYEKTDFVTSTTTYDAYVGYGGECVRTMTAGLFDKNISQDNFIPVVQTKMGLQLYSLKNLSDQLDQYWNVSAFPSGAVQGIEKYISEHPFLFFKDPWGRWSFVEGFDNTMLCSDGG